ncbi:hypothetical protein A2997_01860 [Candidatus Nomurabacteria bacterium RIFCSPLOWO2_01_FULL_36_10b]|uniref:DUF541 domain-containing protein n=1 Tax=Candidatus Nomurabacteria bacterium RIFCSPLOWO2_01_FULL_36_10b TaxID=1801766 RepID=A0A1F6WQS2_9BACT|nr:MAG: hypothetical protein A2997_01860 [Candidatus Nomurabacteria bacterium RIFCSPLOWO2_01_FULL_36_10b]
MSFLSYDDAPKSTLMYTVAGFFIVLTALGIAGFFFMIGLTRPGQGNNTITVQGTGEVMANPDIADITFNVRAEKKDVTTAQKEVTDKIAKITESLIAIGVPKKDIQTQSYSSNPHYEWRSTKSICVDDYGYGCPVNQEQILTGYEVVQTDIITLHDLDLSGKVLEALGKNDVETMWGPNLRVEDPDAAKTAAREEAIKKARAQADTLSKSLNVRIVKLVSFSEDNGWGGPVPMMYADNAMEMGMGGSISVMEKSVPSPDISIGQNKIQSTVYLTYKIK